jgi:hypothetical protein
MCNTINFGATSTLAIMMTHTLKDDNRSCIIIYITKFSNMLIIPLVYNDWLGLSTIQ